MRYEMKSLRGTPLKTVRGLFLIQASVISGLPQPALKSSLGRALNIRQPGSDPLGIPCRLCYKPAEELLGSLEGRSHDDGAAFNIPRAIDPGGNLMQLGRDRLPLPHHAESRSDDL